MELIDQAKDIQSQIDVTFRAAYAALQKANMEMGIAFVQQVSYTVPLEDSIRIKTRSVMGTEIPLVEYEEQLTNTPTYAYYSTKGFSGSKRKSRLRKGKRAFHPARRHRKRSDPSRSQHQEDPETCQRIKRTSQFRNTRH